MIIFGSRSHFLGFEIGVGVPGRHFSSPQYWPWCQSQHPSAHSFCLKKYDIAAEKQKIQDKNISCRSSSDRRSRPLSHKALSCPLACYRSVWKCENVKVWKWKWESVKVKVSTRLLQIGKHLVFYQFATNDELQNVISVKTIWQVGVNKLGNVWFYKMELFLGRFAQLIQNCVCNRKVAQFKRVVNICFGQFSYSTKSKF